MVGGVTTTFACAPDGTRLKKVVPAAPRGCTTAPNPLPTETTLYILGQELVSYSTSTAPCVPTGSKWIKYPTPDTKIEGTGGSAATYTLLKDSLGSVRVVTGPSGTSVLASRYAPYLIGPYFAKCATAASR